MDYADFAIFIRASSTASVYLPSRIRRLRSSFRAKTMTLRSKSVRAILVFFMRAHLAFWLHYTAGWGNAQMCKTVCLSIKNALAIFIPQGHYFYGNAPWFGLYLVFFVAGMRLPLIVGAKTYCKEILLYCGFQAPARR